MSILRFLAYYFLMIGNGKDSAFVIKGPGENLALSVVLKTANFVLLKVFNYETNVQRVPTFDSLK